MTKNLWRLALAIVITLSAAVYQRMTGPTYPIRDSITIHNREIEFNLPRSHGGETDLPVSIQLPDTNYRVYLIYRRYKTDEMWHRKKAQAHSDGRFSAYLPHQPPAGKLEYYVRIEKGDHRWNIPGERTVVVRFKGAVPAGVLAPHVLLMFLAMFMSNLAGIEALVKGNNIRRYAFWTVLLLGVGGMILGPTVQKYAFGAFWTGIPFGYDLTDNKTLLAFVIWLLALFMVRRMPAGRKRWWVVFAAVVLLLVYSIPHSVMGSELDYSTMKIETG